MSAQAHVGDTGTILQYTVTTDGTTPLDISSATLKEVHFRGPNGEGSILTASFGTDGTDGILQVTTVATTWPVSGDWTEQVRIILPGGEWYSTEVSRTVYDRVLARTPEARSLHLTPGEARDGSLPHAPAIVFTAQSSSDLTAGTATLTISERLCNQAAIAAVDGTIASAGGDLYTITFALTAASADAFNAQVPADYRAVANLGTSEIELAYGPIIWS